MEFSRPGCHGDGLPESLSLLALEWSRAGTRRHRRAGPERVKAWPTLESICRKRHRSLRSKPDAECVAGEKSKYFCL